MNEWVGLVWCGVEDKGGLSNRKEREREDEDRITRHIEPS
jgi:hypothetical protein